MEFYHHDLAVTLDNAWWKKAGMESFIRESNAYTADRSRLRAFVKVCLIAINDVEPLRRDPIFRDNIEDGTPAEERVIHILKGFVNGDAIHPVELIKNFSGPQLFSLRDGAHRFYCSVAAGFTHVPAFKGLDDRARYELC
jgi:hypothetical protein